MAETTEDLALDIGGRLVSLVASEVPIVLGNDVPADRKAPEALMLKTVSIMRGLLDLTRQGHGLRS